MFLLYEGFNMLSFLFYNRNATLLPKLCRVSCHAWRFRLVCRQGNAKLKSAYAPRVTRSFIALGSPAAAFSKFAHKPKPMRLGKRAANRNPTQIVREADINLCLRYQELLSYRTMRRIRKAAALSNGMVHSTGFGLSTEENVG